MLAAARGSLSCSQDGIGMRRGFAALAPCSRLLTWHESVRVYPFCYESDHPGAILAVARDHGDDGAVRVWDNDIPHPLGGFLYGGNAGWSEQVRFLDAGGSEGV